MSMREHSKDQKVYKPFFFGPLHTTGSSLLSNKNPMDITASRWSLSV